MGAGHVEVDGAQPSPVGSVCRTLVVEEYWCEGNVVDTANVVWLRTDSGWHRLFFDCGAVFWRRSESEPAAYDMPEVNGFVRLTDLGRTLRLADRVIVAITTRATARGVEVAFEFQGGSVLRFTNVDDRSSYDYSE